MTIGFTELALLALLVCGICWIPAPAFIWHPTGRWLVFGTAIVVMLVCLAVAALQWLRGRRPFTRLCSSVFIRG